MPLQIYVASRTDAKNKATSSPYPLNIQLESAQPTLGELKSQVAKKISILKVERQRITKEDKKPLTSDELKLKDEGLKDGDTVWVKDLGPQVAWRTVFLTEYFGPLFIHPILYHFGQTIYRTQFEHSRMQTLVLYLVLLHYVKRELETIFIHRFSAATMPIFNIFKNSAHYWGLSGLLLGGAVYGPWSSASKVAGTIQDNDTFLIGCTVVWTLAQLGNLISHVILKNLRPAGTRVRKIPRGFAFELVSCPNYFFEIIGWVAITVLTLSPAAAVFAAVSAGQMAIWALKKHKAYRKEFKDYPRGRKAMIPFLF